MHKSKMYLGFSSYFCPFSECLLFLSREKVKTTSSFTCSLLPLCYGVSLYRIQVTIWCGFKADRHSLANKKMRFTLIPEMRYRTATAKRPLLPGRQNRVRSVCDQRKKITCTETIKTEKKKLFWLLFTFFWLWHTTWRSAGEEVKVRHSVHLNIVKVHFMIRSPVNLSGNNHTQLS